MRQTPRVSRHKHRLAPTRRAAAEHERGAGTNGGDILIWRPNHEQVARNGRGYAKLGTRRGLSPAAWPGMRASSAYALVLDGTPSWDRMASRLPGREDRRGTAAGTGIACATSARRSAGRARGSSSGFPWVVSLFTSAGLGPFFDAVCVHVSREVRGREGESVLDVLDSLHHGGVGRYGSNPNQAQLAKRSDQKDHPAMDVPNAVKPDTNVVFTRFDEASGALLHLVTKRYYTLNETGCRVWELIQDTSELERVAEALHEEYEVELGDVSSFVQSFLKKLRAEGLVVLS